LLREHSPWSASHAVARSARARAAARAAGRLATVRVQFGAGPLGVGLGWEPGGGVVVEAVAAQAGALGVRVGDVLVEANGARVPAGVTDVELAALLALGSGVPPLMGFEREQPPGEPELG
jgi:hypothetical protein